MLGNAGNLGMAEAGYRGARRTDSPSGSAVTKTATCRPVVNNNFIRDAATSASHLPLQHRSTASDFMLRTTNSAKQSFRKGRNLSSVRKTNPTPPIDFASLVVSLRESVVAATPPPCAAPPHS